MSQVYLFSCRPVLELNHWVEGQYLCHRSICFQAQSLGWFGLSSITGLKASVCVTGLFGLVRAQSLG